MPVKYFLLTFLGFFIISVCFGQDSIPRKERLSDSVVAHYFVLKADPGKKVGLYTAMMRQHTLLVRGRYENGKKVGTWQFFDTQGRLNERYNYDKQTFLYEAPLYESGDYTYLFDDSLKRGDKLTRPLKIGGIYYGFIPYLNIFKVPFDVFDVNMDYFEADIELLISPMGKLADYNVRLVSPGYEYDRIFNMDVNLLSLEDRTFIPATLNGVPIISRIIIHCSVTYSGGLDFY